MDKKETKLGSAVSTQIFKLKDIKFWIVNYIMSLVITFIVISSGMSGSNGKVEWLALILVILNFILYPVAEAAVQTIMSPSGVFGTLKYKLGEYEYSEFKLFEIISIVGLTSLKRLVIKLIIWLLSVVIAPIGILHLNSKRKK